MGASAQRAGYYRAAGSLLRGGAQLASMGE